MMINAQFLSQSASLLKILRLSHAYKNCSKDCRNLSSVCRQPYLSLYNVLLQIPALLTLCYCSMEPRMNDSDVERHFKHGK